MSKMSGICTDSSIKIISSTQMAGMQELKTVNNQYDSQHTHYGKEWFARFKDNPPLLQFFQCSTQGQTDKYNEQKAIFTKFTKEIKTQNIVKPNEWHYKFLPQQENLRLNTVHHIQNNNLSFTPLPGVGLHSKVCKLSPIYEYLSGKYYKRISSK